MLLDLIQPLGSSSISVCGMKNRHSNGNPDLFQLARVSIGNPLGQVLHIVSGVGRVQSAGEAARTVKPVDENDAEAVWAEHVSDKDYNAGNAGN
jgi:hypothetical protein